MKKLVKGFTLIELMIVVAIIGILAAIAIPNFVKYQLRSKFSEASSNVEGLRKAQEALRQGERRVMLNTTTPDAAYTPGTYHNLGGTVMPGGTVGTKKLPWSTATLQLASAIDWQIEGATYFNYQVATNACPSVPAVANSGICYYVGAVADIDGDAVNGLVGLSKPSLAGVTTHPAAFPGVEATGSSCIVGGNTVFGTPCSVSNPDVF